MCCASPAYPVIGSLLCADASSSEEPGAGIPHAGMCVQRRLVCSVGVSPTRVKGQSPVAWMAGVRETDHLKPIDEAILRVVSESAGRNESECTSGLESA
jgi:hypothetical protein